MDSHYWICDAENFRVYQYEYHYPRDKPRTKVVIHSYYATPQEILPTRIVSEEVNTSAKSIDTYEVSNADFSFRPVSDIFTYKGLDMPPGQTVIDDRVQRVVGYYNGTDLSADHSEAMSKSAQAAVEEIKPSGLGWPVYTLLAVIGLGVGLFGYYWFRRRRK